MKTGFTDPYVKSLKDPGRYTDLAVTGLNLNIKQRGGKYWVFRYFFTGKRQDLSLGVYPEVLYLRDIGNSIGMFDGDYPRGRKPKGYIKYDTSDPEQLQLIILEVW